MDESTLTVLRIVKELQFDGRPGVGWEPIPHTVYWNPAPLVCIELELMGTGVDVRREIAWLVAKGLLSPEPIHSEKWDELSYRLPDGGIAKLSHETIDGKVFLRAVCDGPGDERRALRRSFQQRDPLGRTVRPQRGEIVTEHYSVTTAGLELLAGTDNRMGADSFQRCTIESGSPPSMTAAEATGYVNQELANDPAWSWDETKTWMESQRIKIYDSKSWGERFGIEPAKPGGRGKHAFVEFPALQIAVRAAKSAAREHNPSLGQIAKSKHEIMDARARRLGVRLDSTDD